MRRGPDLRKGEAAKREAEVVAHATLYLYRPNRFSGADAVVIVASVEPDALVAKVKNGAWCRVHYPHVGTCKFMTGVYIRNPEPFHCTLQPGKTYYLRCSLHHPGFNMIARLELVPEEIAILEITKLKRQPVNV